jgi:amidophosphoribosyltransferase
VHHADEYYALGHNGNLINAQSLRHELEERGSIFQSTMDSEVIVHLMARYLKDGLEEALKKAFSRVEGAYSIVMLTRNKVIAARDPRGFRPLSLGRLNGGWVVASETCAFDLVGARYEREVLPGEIITIDEKGLTSIMPFPQVKASHCIFELIYFARPDSQVFGENVYLCRKRLGHNLAREYRPDVDIVMPFPDSGNYAALGYAEESGIPFEMGMIRNHYVGRTFIQPTQPMRDFGVRVKLNPVRPLLDGKKVLIVEDSIIRGTTSRNRVRNLREIGVKEIHMVVSCPPTTYPCPYGIDFSDKGELIAAQKENAAEIARFIGLDSLHYLSREGMVRATGMEPDNFCLACYDGNYPLSPPTGMGKFCFEDR